MSGEAEIHFVGNTTGPAEIRYTPSGVGVASVTVAVSKRKKDGDRWVDDSTAFYRCQAWRDMAEHVAETLDRSGIRVFVKGRLVPREYEAKDGSTRTSLDVDVDEIGPSIRFTSVKVPPKSDREKVPAGGRQQPQDDPWASSSYGAQDASDLPPF